MAWSLYGQGRHAPHIRFAQKQASVVAKLHPGFWRRQKAILDHYRYPMLFTLKKFVSWFLEPANVCLLLLAPGIVLLWTKRYQRTGRLLLTAGLAVLGVFSNGAVARALALSLETRYSPLGSADQRIGWSDPQKIAAEANGTRKGLLPGGHPEIRHIVVLGGGGADTPGFSATNKLGHSAGLDRLVEGVRMAREYPTAKLILSGAGEPGELSNAQLYQNAAVALGIDPSRITRCDTPRDTMDEAKQIRVLVRTDPFFLVTSAVHLPRAVALFRRLSANPIPTPADYLERPIKPWRFEEQLWRAGALETSSAVVHEYVGMVWGRVRGRL